MSLERARELAADVLPGPWRHYVAPDGALILEDIPTGELIAHVYNIPAVHYLEELSPADLLAEEAET